MNDRVPTQTHAARRKALRCLALIVLPTLILDEGLAGPRLRSTIRPLATTMPYLPMLGAPSLRFEEALPPPDLVARPTAGAPPVPALTPTETSVATANLDATRSTTVATDSTATTTPKAVSSVPTGTSTTDAKSPAPILPDTARPVVHAEDFLPYFQIPGSAKQPGDVTLLVPAAGSAPTPAPIPPSSATYTQTPK